jgi:hypothetical protein
VLIGERDMGVFFMLFGLSLVWTPFGERLKAPK